MFDIAILGGGAAGFFAALRAKAVNPQLKVLLLEKTGKFLSKVRISGGGRCNVTNSCFDPKELVKNYPRGSKELLGPFHRFGPRETFEWFESRGVKLKIEEDGRVFPISDSSEEIIQCLLSEAEKLEVTLKTRVDITSIEKKEDLFILVSERETFAAKKLLLASGSSPLGHLFAEAFGHTLQKAIPSLFTLNIPNFPLQELSGISVPKAKVSIQGTSFSQNGALLITHWGFSGPAALKLSAFAASYLYDKNYEVELVISWVDPPQEVLYHHLQRSKKETPQIHLGNAPRFDLPKNLWLSLLKRGGFSPEKKLCELSDKSLRDLASFLVKDPYSMRGKTTHKAEFVTCGGITLTEVNFKTMESSLFPQ